MKLHTLIYEWWSLKYISVNEKDKFSSEEKVIYRNNSKELLKLISGSGWSFLGKEAIDNIQNSMAKATRVKIVSPRNGKIKIVYRAPGEQVFVVDQPRLPLFSLLMHHHGKTKSTVDSDFKCTRCKKEVPEAVKSIVMMEII